MDERVRNYKLHMQFMDSECKLLEKMSLRSAASAPCPIGQQIRFSANGNTEDNIFSRISKNVNPIAAATAAWAKMSESHFLNKVLLL